MFPIGLWVLFALLSIVMGYFFDNDLRAGLWRSERILLRMLTRSKSGAPDSSQAQKMAAPARGRLRGRVRDALVADNTALLRQLVENVAEMRKTLDVNKVLVVQMFKPAG